MKAGKKLFNRDFILVVIGQIISLFGNAILRFVLPYYLLKETGSSALFGIVTACSFLPMVILSLVGGIIADRTNKRNIMVILDFATAVIILVFYLSLEKIPIIPLFIVALMLLYGISGAYQPAVQASITMNYLMKHWNDIMPNRREKTDVLMIIMKKFCLVNKSSRFMRLLFRLGIEMIWGQQQRMES